MNRKNMNFDDKKILKSDFYKNKKVFQIDDIDVDQILVSRKEPYGKKKKKKKKKKKLYNLLDKMIMVLLDRYV